MKNREISLSEWMYKHQVAAQVCSLETGIVRAIESEQQKIER